MDPEAASAAFGESPYRGAGKVRRRIRRLVRSRVFNNARTATRNLDLPIGAPLISSTALSSVHRLIPASARRPQRRSFLHPPVRRRVFPDLNLRPALATLIRAALLLRLY